MTIVSIGSEAEARLGYKTLLHKGVVLNCIEFPAVRKGDTRFRIQLAPHHSADEINMIASGLALALKPAQRAADFALKFGRRTENSPAGR